MVRDREQDVVLAIARHDGQRNGRVGGHFAATSESDKWLTEQTFGDTYSKTLPQPMLMARLWASVGCQALAYK